jgi:CP family cyanate transporter-like MFS transporter
VLNSIVFYTLMAWLPQSYDERGWTKAEGGNLLAIITVAEIVAAFVAPPLADRIRAPRTLLAITVIMEMVGLAFMGLAPGFLTIAVGALFGLGIGAGFACILTLLAESPADAAASARLTAMAYSVTYIVAAIGPLTAGGLLDVTGSWPALYLALVATCLLRFVAIIPLRRGARVT